MSWELGISYALSTIRRAPCLREGGLRGRTAQTIRDADTLDHPHRKKGEFGLSLASAGVWLLHHLQGVVTTSKAVKK